VSRIAFWFDRPPDREGDLFFELVARLGIDDYAIEGDAAQAEYVAFVGRNRATERFGARPKTGPTGEVIDGARVYVLPSTAPEERRRFFEGTWRRFAEHVTGRDLAVRDRFKGMAPEEIRDELAGRRHPFAVCVANLVYDFNLGSILRTANAFLAGEVWIYGNRKADLRAAMGSHVYLDVHHVPDAAAFDARVVEGHWSVVCLEQRPGATPLMDFAWPDRPLMVFGQEGPGIPDELLARAAHVVEIPQHGSIRSLNAGVAAGIAMYDWHAKH